MSQMPDNSSSSVRIDRVYESAVSFEDRQSARMSILNRSSDTGSDALCHLLKRLNARLIRRGRTLLVGKAFEFGQRRSSAQRFHKIGERLYGFNRPYAFLTLRTPSASVLT
jgi:hypothetical protein